jgi:hypothetical protein
LDEELHNLPSSLNIINIKVIKLRKSWVGDVACLRRMKNAYKSLVLKPKGERLLGRSSHNGKTIIRIEYQLIKKDYAPWT